MREKETRGIEEGKREMGQGKEGKRERWPRRVKSGGGRQHWLLVGKNGA